MRRTPKALAAVMVVIVVAILDCGCSSTGSMTARGAEPRSRAHRPTLPAPFTIAAHYSAQALGLDDPSSLAVGPNGDLYVTDLSQRVTVISPSGQVLWRFGRPGSGPGEFRFVSEDPSDPKDIHAKLAIDGAGGIYVSDSGNARVQVFTARGRFLRQFGRFGSAQGQFLSPFDIAVDRSHNVYVVDDQLMTLRKFTPGGTTVWQVGGHSSSDPNLLGHLHLNAIDVHGRLVLANSDNARIDYVDRQSGRAVDAFGNHSTFVGSACEATVDAFGYTYVTGCGRGKDCPAVACGATLVFDRTHQLVAQWPGTTPLLRSPTFGPHGEAFALGRDGSVLRLHITLPRR